MHPLPVFLPTLGVLPGIKHLPSAHASPGLHLTPLHELTGAAVVHFLFPIVPVQYPDAQSVLNMQPEPTGFFTAAATHLPSSHLPLAQTLDIKQPVPFGRLVSLVRHFLFVPFPTHALLTQSESTRQLPFEGTSKTHFESEQCSPAPHVASFIQALPFNTDVGEAHCRPFIESGQLDPPKTPG